MSVHGNPNIIEDGLVFMFDSRNKKSYKGETTTNLVTNPDFSTGLTGWTSAGTSDAAVDIAEVSSDNGGNYFHKKVNKTANGGPDRLVQSSFYAIDTSKQTTVSIDIWINPANDYGILFYGRGTTADDTTWDEKTLSSNGSTTSTIDLGNGWKRYIYTLQTGWYTGSGNTFLVAVYPDYGGRGLMEYKVRRVQVEQKSHATPFVNGTRSATQALIDRAGNTTIEFVNMSYDSNAHFTFDGTDDYIDLGVNLADIVGSSPAGISFVFVAKADDLTNPIGITGDYIGPAGTGFGIKRASSNNKLEFRCYGAGGRIPKSTSDIPTGSYFHGVCTWDSSGVLKIYFNGTLETTDSGASSTWTYGYGDLVIGDIYGSMGVPGEWQGDIPILKIYNRALTDAEVTQSFNAIKSRFGL